MTYEQKLKERAREFAIEHHGVYAWLELSNSDQKGWDDHFMNIAAIALDYEAKAVREALQIYHTGKYIEQYLFEMGLVEAMPQDAPPVQATPGG